jgi:hypothetical protein
MMVGYEVWVMWCECPLVLACSCSDGIMNGDETDTDCGGSSSCQGCGLGASLHATRSGAAWICLKYETDGQSHSNGSIKGRMQIHVDYLSCQMINDQSVFTAPARMITRRWAHM